MPFGIHVAKRVLILLLAIIMVLTACAAPASSVGTPTPPPPTPWITTTPVLSSPTTVPVPTNSPFPVTSTQPLILTIDRLQMIDAKVGWAQGYASSDGQITADTRSYLLRTTDGGETWQDLTPPTRFLGLASATLFAIDAETAWAIPTDYPFSEDPPYVLVWRTTDGGKSWKPSNPVDMSDSFIRLDVSPRPQFMDAKHGWLTLHFEHRVNAINLEYRTGDGGITWEQTKSCFYGDSGAGALKCDIPEYTDAQTGWLTSPPDYTFAGEVDPATTWRVQRTLDGGATWQTIILPHSSEQKECYSSPSRVAIGVIGVDVNCFTPDHSEERYYYLSADRGQTWQVVPQPKDVSFLFLDMMTGWRFSKLGNGYRLERTLDGGVTWQIQTDSLPVGGIQFVDANTGWQFINNNFDLRRTMDGGKTWQRFTPRLLPAEAGVPALAHLETGAPLVFKSIQMIDSLNGWAGGANGYVFHTTDGGKTWQDVTPLYGQIIDRRELFALDAWRAWTTVSFPTYETIWSTIDGGKSWHQINALSEGQTVSLGSIRFLNESTGWFQSFLEGNPQVVRLMKTRDHGVTWEVQSTGQYHYSYAARNRMGFLFLDEQNGFRIEPVDDHTLGELLNATPVLISNTSDGGDTWQSVSLPNLILDTNEIHLDQRAYPGGIQELMQDTLSCEDGTSLRTFSQDTIGLRVICKGAYREVSGTYGYVFVLSVYYLSTDAGATWNRWLSFGDALPRETDHVRLQSEFFLPGGIGWRLNAHQILQTTDGGKTWMSLKTVGWDEAQFNFINAQEGWGIAKSGHAISLIHTIDGGQTWEELKPVITP